MAGYINGPDSVGVVGIGLEIGIFKFQIAGVSCTDCDAIATNFIAGKPHVIR